ncbi:MAG: ABC transporter ATP-binding protein [Lachnospiraceae bacterium]|nr:ABC transporter ATP-binding protein [Lachnospiraceae bacterium]
MFQNLKKIEDIWNKLQFVLTKAQKKLGVVIFGMTLLGAVAETLGVSVIVPFVQAMVDPEQLADNLFLKPLVKLFHLHTSSQLIMLLGISIALVYIIKNLYLTCLSYCRVRYSVKIQRELSVLMMESYMKRGYLFFSQANASNLQRSVTGDVVGVYQIIYQAFRIAAELLTSAAIVIFIMITDFKMAICVIALAGVCFAVLIIGFRKPMQKLGAEYLKSDGEVRKHSLQAFQGIKEVIVMHRQRFFVERFESAYIRQQKAVTGQTVGAESPAFIIEAICVTGLILAVSLRAYNGTDVAFFIPQLAAFAVGAFRILPSLGRITGSFNQIMYYLPSLNSTYDNLREVKCMEEQEMEEAALVCDQIMQHSAKDQTEKTAYLSIENIHWKYPGAEKETLDGINIQIQKSSSVAFIGHSGAGKTTLADIILGLYKPQKGYIRLNGVDIQTISEKWCNCVGYIPQAVYLIDDTIRNNVAFGIDEPDDNKVWQALEQAQLKEFVSGLPDKLDTIVGDRGIRFSGGQCQRVAIARALYNDPPILILDEATSALDTNTETAVMEAINSLKGNKTLIIVAHRLTTIQNCDVIYEIADGKAIQKRKEDLL